MIQPCEINPAGIDIAIDIDIGSCKTA